MILLVVGLIIIGVLISNLLVKVKEEDEKKVEEKKSLKLKDFLLIVRDLDPEIELDFLLEYHFDSNLSDADKEKIETRLIVFSTNYSYFLIKKLIEFDKDRVKHLKKIEYLENLVIENGFSSVSGLSEAYIEYLDDPRSRNYILSILIKFSRINILKFIEFVDSDITIENDFFIKDKKILLNLLQERENEDRK
jgi:hypothetical protein